MRHLLDLLAAIALLVWGSHVLRGAIMAGWGAQLRTVLARGMRHPAGAAATGLGLTAVLQSSTATSLMSASLVGEGAMTLAGALAVMRGAEVGSALLVLVFSSDVSWLAPLLLLVGIVTFMKTNAARAHLGRAVIGLGLMLLALQMLSTATLPMLSAPVVRGVLGTLGDDLLLGLLAGALVTLLAYSSVAVVLLAGAMYAAGAVAMDTAMALVLGVNLGSATIGFLNTAAAPLVQRRVTAGNLVCKAAAVAVALVLVPLLAPVWAALDVDSLQRVVLFHVVFNVAACVALTGATPALARLVETLLPVRPLPGGTLALDPGATPPGVALSAATREALHLADTVEVMVDGLLALVRENDAERAAGLLAHEAEADQSYASLRDFLLRVSHQPLSAADRARWDAIMAFAIRMEQVADVAENLLLDIEDRKIRLHRAFPPEVVDEISQLHALLVDNLRLAVGVFLHRDPRDAQGLLAAKKRFNLLERECAARHLARLAGAQPGVLETSALHIDLIGHLRRINSLACSLAHVPQAPVPGIER